MIHSTVFPSFRAAILQIETDLGMSLSTNAVVQPTVLLRGESYPWPKTESSMKRFLICEHTSTIKDPQLLMPFIDFEDLYVEYLSREKGATENECLGFLQHYGFPTDLLDLSPSLETTRFFANNSHPGDLGMVGAFRVVELSHCFDIIDLTRHPFAERPKRQVAFAARPRVGSYDLKDDAEQFEACWYRFHKTADDLAFAAKRHSLLATSEPELNAVFSQDLRNFVLEHWTQQGPDDPRRHVVDTLHGILGTSATHGSALSRAQP